MKKAIQYGAGNIGRGFLGQLFYQSGYETVFIDVNQEMIGKLNTDHTYPLHIVSENEHTELKIENVRGVNGLDQDAIANEIANADIIATAVGVNVLSRIVVPLSKGLKKRWETKNFDPINIIICENLLDANHYLAKLIKEQLSDAEIEYFNQTVGLVEASIGRMVPVMAPEMQKGNILRVYVEPYCQLPVDKAAFKGEIPEIVNLVPFSPFDYYIQRKLFIHNLGHAITAYLGYLNGCQYIWESIKIPEIRATVKEAMLQSAQALSTEHNIPIEKLHEHIEDLLNRFGNRYLGDTVERVGKDPIRKLSPNDRLIGAAILCIKHNIDITPICKGIVAALKFNVAEDEAAQKIQTYINTKGIQSTLKEFCGLNEDSPIYQNVVGTFQ